MHIKTAPISIELNSFSRDKLSVGIASPEKGHVEDIWKVFVRMVEKMRVSRAGMDIYSETRAPPSSKSI